MFLDISDCKSKLLLEPYSFIEKTKMFQYFFGAGGATPTACGSFHARDQSGHNSNGSCYSDNAGHTTWCATKELWCFNILFLFSLLFVNRHRSVELEQYLQDLGAGGLLLTDLYQWPIESFSFDAHVSRF